MRIVVVGAGVAGLSIAWRLAQRGAEVTVIERAQPGRAATYASAGMIAATAETHAMPAAERDFALRSCCLWPSFAAEIEAASGVPVGYRQDGAVIAALSPEEASDLRARAAAIGVAFLSAGAARERAPMLGDAVEGALWAPADAQADNRALGLALARAASAAGIELLTSEPAVRVDRTSDGFVVRTAYAHYEAERVLVAAGAWSGQILGLEDAGPIPVRPVKGEMIALQPPDAGALPVPLLWGGGIYLVPRGGRLFVGATTEEAGFDTTLSEAARSDLFARAVALVPELHNWPICQHWAGLRPATPDGLPILGETRIPGLFVASGQYRNGILFAPAIAQAMEQLILGHSTPGELAAFSPARFGVNTGLPRG